MLKKSTLDLGKQHIHMYRFFFDVVKPKYGDIFKMANADTDSFVFRTRILKHINNDVNFTRV